MKRTFKKTLFTLLAVITMTVIFCFGASALSETGQCGDNVYWDYNSSTKELVISGSGAMWDYSDYYISPFYSSDIKSVVIKSGVTTIGDEAFYDCENLQRITIPDSVTTIGRSAFSYTAYYNNKNNWENGVLYINNHLVAAESEIKNLSIKRGTKTIASFTFYYHESLQSVTIPDSVTTIGAGAFEYCENLKSVTIPDSVRSIGSSAFYDTAYYNNYSNWENDILYINNHLIEADSYIESVTIKQGTKTIADSAFYDCRKLHNITIPNSITTIGGYAFSSCYSLQSVTIPDSVTTIGNYAFYFCTSLQSIKIPDSVTTIGSGAFWCCGSLRSITIPDSITTIGSSTFSDCDSLQSIKISDNVTTIDDQAFYDCNSLQSITIPYSVTTIGGYAFSSCNNLQSITVDKNSKYFCNDEHGVLFDKNKTKLIQYPIGNKRTEYIIPDNVTTIGDAAFRDCDSLTSVTIPDSVTTIGGYTFSSCYSLQSVTIPDSVTTIGAGAFEYCENLKSVTIPDSVTSIGVDAFYGTPWYDNQPDGVIYVGKIAYEYKGTMPENTSITIKAGTKAIAASAFYKCTGLQSVTIPDSVTTIGACAFEYCENLQSITIPDSVTTIGDEAFYDCYRLESVTIGENVSTIGDYAFCGCQMINSVIIPDSVTVIGEMSLGYDFVIVNGGTDTEYWHFENFTIKGSKGSAAEKYAKDNGFKFVEHTTHTHSYTANVTTPATLTADGKAEYKCSCGDIQKTETIAKVSSITLSATKYIYDGKNKTPKVTIKDSEGKVLTKNVDYKLIVASKRAGIGRYTVKVTFIGKYSGTKNLYFYILPGKTASVKSASQGTTSNKLTWSAVPGATGYTLYYYSNSKKAYKKINTTTNTTYTVKGLLTGTKYTFKIVAYGTTAAGKVYDSETYALLKSATKTKTPELTSTRASSSKGKAYVYHTDVKGETGYTVYYSTSSTTGFKKYANFEADTTMATITGLTSGKTYYFKVRTYIKTDSGYVYSPWSAVKSIKVK